VGLGPSANGDIPLLFFPRDHFGSFSFSWNSVPGSGLIVFAGQLDHQDIAGFDSRGNQFPPVSVCADNSPSKWPCFNSF
jgi:hypothetical protein